jgi:hypothetical protein
VWGEGLLFINILVKVKVSLCFNWAPRHGGVLGEWRYSSTHSLTSALDGRDWPASRPCRFTPRERAPGTPWIGGWLGPRAVLDAVVKRKIPSPRRESDPRTPIVQPVAQRYTDWATTAVINILVVVWNSTWKMDPKFSGTSLPHRPIAHYPQFVIQKSLSIRQCNGCSWEDFVK